MGKRLGLLVIALGLLSCGPAERPLAPRSQTFAELRVIRRGVSVTEAGSAKRLPYPKERLGDGTTVELEEGALCWLRSDGGSRMLVAGPAFLEYRSDAIRVEYGRFFVDSPSGVRSTLQTPRGPLLLSSVRSSIEVSRDKSVKSYVLSGEIRAEGNAIAKPGEELLIADGPPKHQAVLSWDDWTGGLATSDREASPAPFGVGTVGARIPGQNGRPRRPLAVQRMDVHVDIVDDLAITEVDQTFFNTESDTVEGIYAFRTPVGATLHRFGVDRGDRVIWGYVKEKAQADAQYRSHVFEGSTEDPALLEWWAPGVYRARLYPIKPAATRRVISRYAEWLARTGEKGERRHYIYPMAADGSEGSLPRIEELTITIDLAHAQSRDVRVGMEGVRDGQQLIVRRSDFVPRADLSVELFDEGTQSLKAYRSKHQLAEETLSPDDRQRAKAFAQNEADYILVPLKKSHVQDVGGGLDLAIVVDCSAATDTASLALARAASGAILAHLGSQDRAAIWATDTKLRAIAPGLESLKPVDKAMRDATSSALARIERGGATDLGAVLSEAASRLDSKRRGAVVYIGDGRATVGERSLLELREKLNRLPRPVRLFTMGIGNDADMALLSGISRGAFSERVGDGASAAQAALRLLEEAERPVWLGATVSLGPNVDRVYPRDLGASLADESILVLGRVTGASPKQIQIQGPGGTQNAPLRIVSIPDQADLLRRWAQGRLGDLLDQEAGRAAVVEVGMRYGILTPFTSFYVPTSQEASSQGLTGKDIPLPERERSLAQKAEKPRTDEQSAGDQEKPVTVSASSPLMAPGRAAKVSAGKGSALERADAPSTGIAVDDALSARGNMWGDQIGDAFGAGGLGLSGVGESGGGRDSGIGLGSIGTLGHGAGTGTGQGFGSGHGRLGGSHSAGPPVVKYGEVSIAREGLPKEVINRIVRQNYGRYRLCYENGLRNNPNLQGRVAVRFLIDRHGGVTVTNGGSDLPDASVVACVMGASGSLSFPEPEGGPMIAVFPIMFAPDSKSLPKEKVETKTGQGLANQQDQALAKDQALANNEKQAKSKGQQASKAEALKTSDALDHRPSRCSPAASLPLEDRVALWKERLLVASSNVDSIADIFQKALVACEIPTSRERVRLLSLMVDSLKEVKERVELWKKFASTPGIGDVVYGTILGRIKTAAEMTALRKELGIRTVDEKTKEKALAGATTPAERAQRLRKLSAEWKDDLGLQLELIETLEDAADEAGASDLAQTLRRRPDSDAHVRTVIGEYYFRLAQKKNQNAGLIDEALRCFGEIVEFAPDDPVVRRRLGDLLRAHGYYAEAGRHYESLEKLAPDDPTVAILRAAAAQGIGKLEESVRWTEKAMASVAPTGEAPLATTARAFALSYLAWERASSKPNETEKIQKLLLRTERLYGQWAQARGTRVALTWSHPDIHPVLWSGTTTTLSPSVEGEGNLGIGQVQMGSSGGIVELRLDADEAKLAARYGASLLLTAVFNEGTSKEKVLLIPIQVSGQGNFSRRFQVRDGRVDPQ